MKKILALLLSAVMTCSSVLAAADALSSTDLAQMFEKAWAYENGNGVEQDFEEAVFWYRVAAEAGYAPAQCNLARCYLRGIGVTQSDEEARKW